MGHTDRIARARGALDTVERLLSAPANRETDQAAQAELRHQIGELRRLLASLQSGDESAVPPRTTDARGASAI